MNASAPTAELITRASKSNLALSFVALPRERRRDISTFYAFCRIIDDIADEPGFTTDHRRSSLNLWRESLVMPKVGEPALASAVRDLISKYGLAIDYFREIIAGVEMDLSPDGFETWEELRLYCHRVAGVVGLVSIEIFGYTDPKCRQYAVDLGLALQLTNILRDLGQDYANGQRIYLPREDLRRFGYTARKMAMGCRDATFLELMAFETQRAKAFYESAGALVPAKDRRNMAAAEIMRAIYTRLLNKMENDRFQVFSHRYRLNAFEKSWCIFRVLLKNSLLALGRR